MNESARRDDFGRYPSPVFGARTALAAPTADLCPDHSIGRCTNQVGCQSKCEGPYPGTGLIGLCENGCCYCLEA